MKKNNFELSNYNEKSQIFVKRWIGTKNIIGVKQCHDRKDENLVFYKSADGIRICVLTLKYSKNNGACFYGDLTHLAKMIYCHIYGYDFEKICYWYDGQKMKRIDRCIHNFIESFSKIS